MAEESKRSDKEMRAQLAHAAAGNEETLSEVVDELAGASRVKRQKAASIIALVADENAAALLPFVEDISAALGYPEAQTRWEVLHALDCMGKVGQRYDEDVIAAAEDALYDENSGIVREAAFRFFCGYGAASPANSDEVWPLIDEAIQCYHGNGEFADMLTQLVEFAQGNISMETSAALALRMKFDAENASGTLRMRAGQILQAFEERGGTV